jgi:hypothetical protein
MKRKWEKPENHPGDWYEVKAIFSVYLSDKEAWTASGCIGYALRQVLCGENLSEPLRIKRSGDGKTSVRYGYDSTKSQRDDCHDSEAFDLAARYVVEGSPVRSTDRAGTGTKGTRLCEGVGQVGVEFYVR